MVGTPTSNENDDCGNLRFPNLPFTTKEQELKGTEKDRQKLKQTI